MEMTSFAIEYHTDTSEFNENLREKVEKRLQKLAKGKRGIERAVVAVKSGNGTSQLKEYRVRIALYDHSTTATAIEKGDSLDATVSKSLSTVERQFRESRDKRRSLRRRSSDNGKTGAE